MNEKDIIFNILTIIGYQDNKIEFVSSFFAQIFAEAIARTTYELSDSDRAKIGNELATAEDEEAQKAIILQYMSQTKFEALLTEISREHLTDYLETIFPKLTEEKSERLSTYLRTLENPAKAKTSHQHD